MVESGGQRVRILRESGCSTDPQLFPYALFVLDAPRHLAHHHVEHQLALVQPRRRVLLLPVIGALRRRHRPHAGRRPLQELTAGGAKGHRRRPSPRSDMRRGVAGACVRRRRRRAVAVLLLERLKLRLLLRRGEHRPVHRAVLRRVRGIAAVPAVTRRRVGEPLVHPLVAARRRGVAAGDEAGAVAALHHHRPRRRAEHPRRLGVACGRRAREAVGPHASCQWALRRRRCDRRRTWRSARRDMAVCRRGGHQPLRLVRLPLDAEQQRAHHRLHLALLALLTPRLRLG